MTAADIFTVGALVRLSTTFVDGMGAPYDPATVSVQVKNPVTGTTTTNPGTVVRDAAGAYSCEFVPTAAGFWPVRWRGDGTGVEIRRESTLIVREVVAPRLLA